MELLSLIRPSKASKKLDALKKAIHDARIKKIEMCNTSFSAELDMLIKYMSTDCPEQVKINVQRFVCLFWNMRSFKFIKSALKFPIIIRFRELAAKYRLDKQASQVSLDDIKDMYGDIDFALRVCASYFSEGTMKAYFWKRDSINIKKETKRIIEILIKDIPITNMFDEINASYLEKIVALNLPIPFAYVTYELIPKCIYEDALKEHQPQSDLPQADPKGILAASRLNALEEKLLKRDEKAMYHEICNIIGRTSQLKVSFKNAPMYIQYNPDLPSMAVKYPPMISIPV